LAADSFESHLAAVEVALADADATLSTTLGGDRTVTAVRLWRGQRLVDWEPDPSVGDCLFRPELLRRLVQLHASIEVRKEVLSIEAPGRIVASLSPEHAALVRQLGGARRTQLRVDLSFKNGSYTGGTETFEVVDHGRRSPLMQLRADVSARQALPRTSPLPR
jgi:hypothetical protein